MENKEGVWITGKSGCVIEPTRTVEESKEGADNERRESHREVTERQKDARMRFTVQLLFNLL